MGFSWFFLYGEYEGGGDYSAITTALAAETETKEETEEEKAVWEARVWWRKAWVMLDIFVSGIT